MTGSITGWVKLFFCRLIFAVKLMRICRKKRFNIKTNGFFWWLGKNKSGKWNFTVECLEKSYCVKLIGVRSRRILFGFIDESHYEIKDYTFAMVHTMDGFEYSIRNKDPYLYENGSEPCIVMVPDSVKITVRSRNGRTEIGNGDTTPEGVFFFGKSFLKTLKENEDIRSNG